MVAAYGVCTLAFGLSSWLVLSLIALVGVGVADAISVVIRHSLVQSRTPNEMLGRVMAVNSMFTGTSSTLGEFRAGLMASWFGAVPAVVFGGVCMLIASLVTLPTPSREVAPRRLQKVAEEEGMLPTATPPESPINAS